MAKPYPNYLTPIALSLKWDSKITDQSVADSYSLFVRQNGTGEDNSNKKPATTADERILGILQNKHLTVPFNIVPDRPAAISFLQDYKEALESQWVLKKTNATLMELATAPVSFSRPMLPNGDKISNSYAILLKYFSSKNFFVIPANHSYDTFHKPLDNIDYRDFTQLLPSTDEYDTKRAAAYSIKELFESSLITYKYFGTRGLRDSLVCLAGGAIAFTIALVLFFSAPFADSLIDMPWGASAILAILLAALIGGLGGLITGMLSMLITLAISGIAGRTIIDFGGDQAVYFKVKLTPHGKAILEQWEAWENYKVNNPESNYSKEEQEDMTRDKLREKIAHTRLRLKMRRSWG